MVELGLSPSEFRSLTWYDWGLYAFRLRSLQNKRELDLELKRIEIANFINAHRRPNTPAVNRQDILKLSYDTQLDQYSDPELFARVARRLGGTIKKKDSGNE